VHVLDERGTASQDIFRKTEDAGGRTEKVRSSSGTRKLLSEENGRMTTSAKGVITSIKSKFGGAAGTEERSHIGAMSLPIHLLNLAKSDDSNGRGAIRGVAIVPVCDTGH